NHARSANRAGTSRRRLRDTGTRRLRDDAAIIRASTRKRDPSTERASILATCDENHGERGAARALSRNLTVFPRAPHGLFPARLRTFSAAARLTSASA